VEFSTSSPIHQWAPGQSLLPALCTLFHLPQVLVNLNDINDNCPTFPRPYEGPFDVTEGQPGPRIWTFLAHDGDSGPGGQVEYSIIAGDPLGEQGRGVLAPKLCARSSGMAPSLLPRLTREHGMQPTLMEKMGSPSFFALFCGFLKQILATRQGGGWVEELQSAGGSLSEKPSSQLAASANSAFQHQEILF